MSRFYFTFLQAMPLPSTITKPAPAPTTAEVERISSIPNPVLRNLLITQCYCELAVSFAERTGLTANWCTFATWASKQAGQTIRSEDLQRLLVAMLKNEPGISQALSLLIAVAKELGAKASADHLQHDVMLNLLQGVAKKAGDAVARGNKKVFEEIALHFARFMSLCYHDEAFTETHLDALLKELKQGLPPGGQDYLRRAFTHYYQSFFETDEKKKLELCFLANLEIGFHEQTRLQPEIAEALNAAFLDPVETKAILQNSLFSEMSLWSRVVLFVKRIFGRTSLLAKATEALRTQVEEEVRKMLTRHLMTLTLPPNNRLSLGRDLATSFPENLKKLQNNDLLLLLKETDLTPDDVFESGATDWANLQERMHYITDLFRCYHCSKDLFASAFTQEQVNKMKAGEIPAGDL